jgi:uncharacterized protein (AIM24 family)
VDVRIATTDSGWTELPAIRDMTKIQFGQSFCQIMGKYVPIADFQLAEGDGLFFPHHLLLSKDDEAKMAVSQATDLKQVFMGRRVIMMEVTGPGRVAFSKDQPGELFALPLQPGQAIDVRELLFMVATRQFAYEWFMPQMWVEMSYRGHVSVDHPVGMHMDRFSAGSTPGLLLLHGEGNVFARRLKEGETMLVNPRSIVFKDLSVTMNLHIEYASGRNQDSDRWTQQYVWARLRGPGRVAIQSQFPFANESLGSKRDASPGTTEHWWNS